MSRLGAAEAACTSKLGGFCWPPTARHRAPCTYVRMSNGTADQHSGRSRLFNRWIELAELVGNLESMGWSVYWDELTTSGRCRLQRRSHEAALRLLAPS